MNQSSDSKIDRLRRRLDSQNKSESRNNSSKQLSSKADDSIPTGWDHDDEDFDNESTKDTQRKKPMSFLNKLLIFASIFFIAAFSFAAYNIGIGGNGITPDNVLIEINGPSNVSVGDTVTFNIEIRNKNKVDLQHSEIVVVYPSGTREAENTGKSLRQTRETVGVIPANGNALYNVDASLFGERGDEKQIQVQLEYRIQDSNAIFLATEEFDIEISESPVSFTISGPSETTTNEPFGTTLTIESNAAKTLKNIILVADYPLSFTPNDINPSPDYRDYVWFLGDISPGEEREIELSGEFNNSSSGEQTFRYEVGTARENENTEIGTLFASQDLVMSLREAFIDVSLDLDNIQSRNEDEFDISGRINWKSNLDSVVRGAELSVTFSGEGVDLDSLETQDGLFRSSENTLIWNSRTNDEFSTINPGDSGTQRFWFNTNNSSSLANTTENPTVDFDIRMEAQSSESSSLPPFVTSSLQRTIKLPTVVDADIQTLHEDGPFNNSGPVPPQVGETTTYTLHISIQNTTNDIEEASFQAALPAYVEIRSNTSPADADINYNDISGRLSWDIGSIPAGAGFTQPVKEAFVQIELIPSSSHRGLELPLLADPSISGVDSFTGEMIQMRSIKIPTIHRADDSAGYESDKVEG